jgi:tetratricopeptide (TPR) repeat protein
MREVSTVTTATTSAAPDPADEVRLDRAIARADQILVASLKQEEQRRRRRFTLAGGLIMLGIAATIVAVPLSAQVQVSAADKQLSTALNSEGWALFQRRDLSTAESKFQQAVDKNPTNSAAWNGLGWSRLNQGKRDQAAEAFKKMVELDPKNAGAARNGLGWIEFGKQNFDEAERWWKDANAPAAWSGLAQLYLLKGNWDEALKWANKALLAGEKSAKEYADAAKAKSLPDELRQRIDPAAQPQQAAAAHQTGGAGKSDAIELMKQGWQRWHAGDLPAAEEKFSQAVTSDPKLANAWNGLGWSRFNQGKRDEALDAFNRCLAIMPAHGAALNGLGQIYLVQGKLDDAEQALKKAAPTAPAAWWGLAKVYLLQSKWDDAAKWSKKIVDSGDVTAQPLLDAAKARKLDDALRQEIAPTTQPG